MAGRITLTPLARTSPTLWSHMRLCGLRGALAASRDADRWVLHDPRMWLGTAFHKVMQRPGAAAIDAEAVWTTSIGAAAAAAARHPLDARYAAPERWPGYYLIRQRALASSADAAARTGRREPRAVPDPSAGVRGHERGLEARGGRLVGRPDRFEGDTLTEYKSSLPDPAWPGAAAALDSIHRQLRLYAAIIAEATGRWPARGRIIAASGQMMDVRLVPAACDAEASAALAALDALNRGLSSNADPESLAQPGSAACGTCPFQALCPAFWRWLDGAGPQDLPEAAAEGVLDRVELGQEGDLYSACLALRGPAAACSEVQPLVLRRSTHGDLTASQPGARWRVVSARVRSDGRLRADLSTCVFALDDLPGLMAGPSERASGA